MDDQETQQDLCTERRLIFDETEESLKSATGTTNDVRKPDGDIIDMVGAKGQDEITRRENKEYRELDEIGAYEPNEERNSAVS